VRFLFRIAALALAASTAFSQGPPASEQHKAAQWETVGQLCGILEFAMPKEKTTTTAEGKTKTRLYPNVLKRAKVELYKGTASEETLLRRKNASRTDKIKHIWQV
jgi:hypothetical protein